MPKDVRIYGYPPSDDPIRRTYKFERDTMLMCVQRLDWQLAEFHSNNLAKLRSGVPKVSNNGE